MLHNKWNIGIFLFIAGLLFVSDRIRLGMRIDQDHTVIQEQAARIVAFEAAMKQVQIIQIEQEKLIEDIRSSQHLNSK